VLSDRKGENVHKAQVDLLHVDGRVTVREREGALARTHILHPLLNKKIRATRGKKIGRRLRKSQRIQKDNSTKDVKVCIWLCNRVAREKVSLLRAHFRRVDRASHGFSAAFASRSCSIVTKLEVTVKSFIKIN
jgi:hypothetical protein